MGAYGTWALVAVVLVALIKGWPALKKLRNDADNDLRARVERLEAKADDALISAHHAEMKLVSALAAYRLLASELLKLSPDNPILKQAQELLNVSYPTPRTAADAIRPIPMAGTP